MQLMQYTIPLPADYDMEIIRQRVATKGHFMDTFPGLLFKAYLIREKGQSGAGRNEYAPFYLWREDEGLARFVWGGGGFGNVIESFGRPSIAHWTHHGHEMFGDLMDAAWAMKHTETLGVDEDPGLIAAKYQEQLGQVREHQGALLYAAGLNVESWQLCHFTLWKQMPTEQAGERYQVLHLSQPIPHCCGRDS